MKIVFLGICILLAAIYISDALEAPAKVERDKLSMETTNSLMEEQTKILLDLDAMGNATVSEFANDWRVYYKYESKPSLESNAELKIIQQKIKANPDAAKEFTLAHHRESAEKFNSAISTPLGTKMTAKPGL